MLSGADYDVLDEDLAAERIRCKELCKEYNSLHPSDSIGRASILHRLLGEMNGEAYIEQPFNCDYGYNITVGDNFYSNYHLVILDVAPVIIGNNVFIAPNVSIYTAGHPIHSKARNSMYEYGIPIEIGSDCWIGGGVTICPGVKIGNGAVIGAGSVVTRDVPDNVVAAGNPCKVIREITDDDLKYYFKDREFGAEELIYIKEHQ